MYQCTVIGEAFGGAERCGVGDRLLMFELLFIPLLSPEGCAAIVWKMPAKLPKPQLPLKRLGISKLRNSGSSAAGTPCWRSFWHHCGSNDPQTGIGRWNYCSQERVVKCDIKSFVTWRFNRSTEGALRLQRNVVNAHQPRNIDRAERLSAKALAGISSFFLSETGTSFLFLLVHTLFLLWSNSGDSSINEFKFCPL